MLPPQLLHLTTMTRILFALAALLIYSYLQPQESLPGKLLLSSFGVALLLVPKASRYYYFSMIVINA